MITPDMNSESEFVVVGSAGADDPFSPPDLSAFTRNIIGRQVMNVSGPPEERSIAAEGDCTAVFCDRTHENQAIELRIGDTKVHLRITIEGALPEDLQGGDVIQV